MEEKDNGKRKAEESVDREKEKVKENGKRKEREESAEIPYDTPPLTKVGPPRRTKRKRSPQDVVQPRILSSKDVSDQGKEEPPRKVRKATNKRLIVLSQTTVPSTTLGSSAFVGDASGAGFISI